MAKRKNPFGECTPMQLKMHVGAKEAASSEERERVHAHTRALLFHGANPTASYVALQALGGPNGVTSMHKPLKQGTDSTRSACMCVHCKNPGGSACSDCNRFVCCMCVRECCVCNSTFCQLCSILSYSKSEVHSVCLNCLSTFSSS